MSETDQELSAAAGRAGDVELRSRAVRVRPATRELLVDHEPVPIERRAFDLLVYLMRHPDRVVDKDELLREVWQGRPVSESTVAQAASRVRKALGGEPDDWIATVYGVGYRFTAPVDAAADAPSDPSGPRRGGVRRAGAPLLGVVLVAVLIAVLAAAWVLDRPTAPEELRIAVLPVQNETNNAELDWVRLGVLPLIDRALDEGGVERVQTNQVLSTLSRYPDADDPAAQARVLRLNTRADRVLVPRLFVDDGGYRLEVASADPALRDLDVQLQGDDVAVLAVAAGASLSESLSRWQGSKRARSGLVTDDPFINEAFARGLDARLRGQWEEAARYFDTVLAAAPELLDAKYHLALVTRRLGDWEYTEQLHAELMDAAREGNDPGMLATVQMASGNLAWRLGNKEDAERFYQQALTHFREHGNANYVANALGNLGILAATRAEYDLAEERMQAALEHYRAVGDGFNEATVLKNIGNLQADQGRYADAERTLLDSLEIRQRLELPVQIALTMSVLGDVEMARGWWAQALAHQQRVFETAERHDSPIMAIQALSDISAALRRLGRLEDAVANAADAYARATELGSPTNQAFALLQQGRAELDRGRSSVATELFERSARVYVDIDQPLGATMARIARGGIAGSRPPGRCRGRAGRNRQQGVRLGHRAPGCGFPRSSGTPGGGPGRRRAGTAAVRARLSICAGAADSDRDRRYRRPLRACAAGLRRRTGSSLCPRGITFGSRRPKCQRARIPGPLPRPDRSRARHDAGRASARPGRRGLDGRGRSLARGAWIRLGGVRSPLNRERSSLLQRSLAEATPRRESRAAATPRRPRRPQRSTGSASGSRPAAEW